ncbi:D-xylose transporter XylE [Pelagerythrobacter aerophilus]|uniref:D-xylose transporter XylE n=1 Tax=Pelagerythrobacter aerophilus TaxID=2306995 RepID=A0A418NG07_9SPHN|nr:D-xylose transporter XylE [Pelagerythrobacter aerophilus]RIV76989.1 D-xylose transporter XylE [Pelagerythrobacter aerophilus]
MHQKVAEKSGSITFAVLTATLGGLLFGYDTAVISGAIEAIDVNFIDPRGLAPNVRDSLSGFTVASALIGTVIGAAMAGMLATRFGRRRSLILAAALFFASALGSAWPEIGFGAPGSMGPDALTLFNVYRILGGIGVGLASMISPMYIAEIAPSERRGQLVTWQQLAIIGGMLVVYFVNWGIARQGDEQWVLSTGWRLMFASECIPAVLFFGMLFFIPESPRWLVQKGDEEGAVRVLHSLGLRRPGLLDEIRQSLVIPRRPLFSYGAALIVVGLLLSVFQQFVGINVVLYYAPFIFKSMGSSTDTALLQTIAVGAINLGFTVLAMLTVDRWGRKPLMITGAVVMALSMGTLGTLFYVDSLGLGALLAMLVYIAGFALSWGPVVWVLLAEIFPNPVKGQAMALAVTAQWISNFLVSWSFKVLDGDPTLVAMFNHGFAYWLYGAMSVLAALFVWKMLPETKGRTLEEMGLLWKAEERP